MKRILHKTKDFKKAEDWDIMQHVQMTPEQRQEASAELRKRAYGKSAPDVREAQQKR